MYRISCASFLSRPREVRLLATARFAEDFAGKLASPDDAILFYDDMGRPSPRKAGAAARQKWASNLPTSARCGIAGMAGALDGAAGSVRARRFEIVVFSPPTASPGGRAPPHAIDRSADRSHELAASGGAVAGHILLVGAQFRLYNTRRRLCRTIVH